MTDRTRCLRDLTLRSENKCMRAPCRIPSVAGAPMSLPERKALALARMLEEMPLYIGEGELIVGTRTLYTPHADNADGHDIHKYYLDCMPEYLRPEERTAFGNVVVNIVHYTPDYGILLEKGIGGILDEAEARLRDRSLKQIQIDFLHSLVIAYEGLSALILRYAELAGELAGNAADAAEKSRLEGIAGVCRNIAADRPRNFREAVQLLWFGALAAVIESGWFINYGRLDVILGKYLGSIPYAEGEELIECLMMKMYDQADIIDGEYFGRHEGQLVVTLGGVLPDGSDAVNDVTMMFLDAIEAVRLPEPEYNLRLNSKNPERFLDKAASLTVRGYNYVSYYNDDRFIHSLTVGGLPVGEARNYGFDLCQDITIPGTAHIYMGANRSLAHDLMAFLKENHEFASFEALYSGFKAYEAELLKKAIGVRNRGLEQMMNYRDEKYSLYFSNAADGWPYDWHGSVPTCPLPFLSGLYHGAVENALDVIYECYPLKDKGVVFGTAVEAANSLAAIKKAVYTDGLYTLAEVYLACAEDFGGEGYKVMQRILRSAPKWGNDDPFVDLIAKDLLEFCLAECRQYRTPTGGHYLSGIHQPHPVATGHGLMATPDGRHSGAPVAVTMSPQNGTMKNGPTAAMHSAAVFDPDLIQWNYCFMVNYYASVFAGNDGKDNFKTLLRTFFEKGGMQHQPNVLDAAVLRKAQAEPENYKDLIVRLWGVSAHFVDLTREVQDEMIARVEA